MKKLGMKLFVGLFCCNIILWGILPATVFAEESGSTARSESVETWMPDPNLRKAVAYYLGGINPEEITKEAMANLDMLTFDQYTLDIPEDTVVDFTGLEYAGELLTFDSTYVIAKNVPTIKVADRSLVYVMPNVLKKLETTGRVSQLDIGKRYGEGVPTSELIGLGEDIHRMNPADSLRIFSKDMADFSAIGIQSEALTDTNYAEFVTQTQLVLPDLKVEKDHTGKVLYTQDALKDFRGNSLLSSVATTMPTTVQYLDENKEYIDYPFFDYTDEGMEFENIPEEAAYVYIDFARIPTRLSNNANTRALNYDLYSLNALIPIVRFQPGADVTVKYQDEEGETLADDEILSGNIGENYTSEKKTITGYTFKEVQGNPTGPFTDQPQTVTYIYTKSPVPAADVTVKYQDTNGKTLANDEKLSGNIGENYTSEQKTITGYTFKEVQGSPTGPFTPQPQTVIYVYTKNAANTSSVTVHYQDEAGKSLADTVTLTGKVGETYSSEQKKSTGYNFKEVRGNPKGQFTTEAQTVTYVYTQAASKKSTVIAKYQDEKGNKLVDEVVLTGTIGDSYKTEQKKIDGYTFKEVQGTPEGKFTETPQSVVYIYTKKNSAATDDPSSPTGNTVIHSVHTSYSNGTAAKALPNTGEETTVSRVLTLAGIVSILALGSGVVVWKRKKA
ncbi:MucBP domain-containing protein [Enterococcus raffinosus]|uniref:MucBP domain-containing protein n=1 Tax=Enterococcus raffinosus TaxID=71452 RepID=UPI003D6B4B36